MKTDHLLPFWRKGSGQARQRPDLHARFGFEADQIGAGRQVSAVEGKPVGAGRPDAFDKPGHFAAEQVVDGQPYTLHSVQRECGRRGEPERVRGPACRATAAGIVRASCASAVSSNAADGVPF